MLPHPCFFARKDKERKRQIDEEERKKSRGKANSRILQFLKDEASFSPSARLTFFCFRSRRLALQHLPFLFELPLSISENQDRRARPSQSPSLRRFLLGLLSGVLILLSHPQSHPRQQRTRVSLFPRDH